MMSRNLELPVLTPSTVTVGREQIVIVEFAGLIPQSSLVTFNFYHYATGKKLSTVPIVPLGPHTAKAKFPEFSKNGEVEVIVHINREESTLMPRFRFHVQSQVEAIFAPALQGSNRKALLASILAYLTHCDEKNKEMCAQADALLCNLLQQIHTFELSDWSVGALLTGKHGPEENLLHFCARRHLSETAEHLLLSMPNSKKQEYLYQRSSDNKTPIELAQKNDMRRVIDIADQMMVQAGSTSKKTKGGKKKKSMLVEKSRSIDSQINHLCIPGSPDVTTKSSTFSQSPDHKRKENKASNLKTLKKHFKKDKGVPVVSSPQQSYINEFGEPMIAPTSPGPQSPTLLISQSMESIDRTATWSEPSRNPFSDNHIPSSYGTASPVLPSSPLMQPRHEIPTRSSVTFPRSARPGSRTDSVGSSSSSFDQGDSRILQVEQRQARPVSSSLSGASDQGSALSKAMKELESKALYVAEVVQEYNWASVTQGDSDCILKMGHRVFVTQEGVEGDHKMCLGVWMGRYGKLPLAILRPLPHTELQKLRALGEIDNYEKVDDTLWLGDEDDVYKVPRNVPAHSYMPGSDSEDDQPVYDIPPNRFRNLPTDTYDIPPNRFRNLPTDTPNTPASPYIKTSDSDEDPVYDVPPNRHLFPEEENSDHDYLNIPREQLLALSELVKQPMKDDMKQSAKTDHNSQISSSQMEDGVRDPHGVTEKKRSHTIAECITFPVQDTANEDQEDDSHIYDDLDSALSETLLLIQSVTDADYNDFITPSLNGNHKTKMCEGTDVTKVSRESSDTYSHLTPAKLKTKYEDRPINNESIPPTDMSLHINVSKHHSNKAGTENSDTYSSLTPKTERKTITPNFSHEIRYAEITAVRNIVQGDSEQMTVGRVTPTPTESDDVFQQASSYSPTPAPKPKKRTRFLTSTSPPMVSPKPKPRRLTAPLKSEGDEPTSRTKIEQILANSFKMGELGIATPVHQTHAKTEQRVAEPGETKLAQQTSESTKPSYVNIQMRTKSSKPPPSPPRKRSSHSTSSPGTVKKPSPQVAPKPVVAKKQ